MSEFWISQVFAAAALVCGLLSFQLPRREQVLLLLAGTGAFNAIHFYLLNQVTACAVAALTACRLLSARHTTRREVMLFFVAAAVLAGVLTAENPVNYLGVVAMVVATVGCFQSDNLRVRYAFMAGAAIWALHNYLVWTPVALVMELMFLTSNIIGALRLRRQGLV